VSPRPRLFSILFGASLCTTLVGSACDSRPGFPIDDEEDARVEAGPSQDAGQDAEDASADVSSLDVSSSDAAGDDASSDADAAGD
jgi:hypothetical protein